MVVLAAVAITAIVVGVTAALIARQATHASIHSAIGGRTGSDVVDEHRRMLAAANKETAAQAARADLLRLALDALASGVIVTDHAGKELVRNRLATQVSTQLHEKTLVESAAAELLGAAARGARVERQVDLFGPPARTLAVHAVPVMADANVIGALAVIDDVTDRHRIEKTRRDFIANLSHELRTPVGAASLLGEMLVDEDDVLVRHQLTDRLLIETDRMTATIDGLLTLSRIESHQEAFDESISVQPMIDEALERTRVAAETGEVQVGSVLLPEPVEIQGNRDQLLTAVVNLVENAIKYSQAGATVSVRTFADDQSISLVVQDTGPGIPSRDLDRIFERFYRVDRSRDSTTGGTGIGLSIVRHVALNHGGSIDVTSFEGEGSTFTMVLPRSLPRDSARSLSRPEVS